MAHHMTGTFGAVGRFFNDIGRARNMALTYERLARLSDNELGRRGLKRTELAQEAARRCGF
ncbi:hypothetical protein [Pararhizobium mangrovi]|uniref:DUF1127 domain-containing protein n=1 Tax=Pararhizobium mangrovi TaxID=2590452 RepID=A0A506TWL8_9HYPH|nr:hypothetical protein [Pararhizobium mangrovi]TPW26463.1 hypothetical protein FJU11_14780 [Pararhizobium mangrovi]